MSKKTTWRKLIKAEMKRNGDSFKNLQGTTLTNRELNANEVDTTYGYGPGMPWRLWTTDYVYYSHEHDDGVAAWVESQPRNPGAGA